MKNVYIDLFNFQEFSMQKFVKTRNIFSMTNSNMKLVIQNCKELWSEKMSVVMP